jgi:hypothetical protein
MQMVFKQTKGGIHLENQYAIVPHVVQDLSLHKNTFEQNEEPWLGEASLQARSNWFGRAFGQYLSPLLHHLHQKMDIRPIRNLIQAVEAILSFRDRANGLLLSELGDAMDGMGAEGGGTKRLGRLIHHLGWKAKEIEAFLLWRADQALQELEAVGEDALLIWDGSPWEKPESLKAEGLCAVRSSKAKRLTRIKKGYYNPPRGPIFVPGLHAIGLLLASRHKAASVVQLVLMRWWTSRGIWASFERDEQLKLLRVVAQEWGKRLLHVFDQGFSGSPWLGALHGFDVRFTIRWNKKFHLVSTEGIKQPPWHFSRGKKGLEPRQIYDAVKKKTVEGTVLWYAVEHPDFPGWQLTLVVSRRKNGKPWYLLTNEPVETADDAWRIAMAYIRRWQIEMAFRHLKSEMAIQSLRVYDWEPRLKLLGLVSLAYAFLMELMKETARRARDWLLDYACHRTGSHVQDVAIPLTRLRIALSKLWQQCPCLFVRRGAVFR